MAKRKIKGPRMGMALKRKAIQYCVENNLCPEGVNLWAVKNAKLFALVAAHKAAETDTVEPIQSCKEHEKPSLRELAKKHLENIKPKRIRKTNNVYAERRAAAKAFYDSDAWKRLRYQALKMHGAICQCCGASRADGVQIHVDHIKPRSKYPHLELELSNLQILCEPCNIGKSAVDETDWRDQPKTRGTVLWN